MSESDKFWDRKAEGYAKSPVSDEETYQRELSETQSFFTPDMQVLEFGCGTGSTAILHTPYVKHIHATDISPKMIEIAQGKAAAENIENVTFECASIDTCSVPYQSLDAVMGHNILHLVANKEEVIAKVHKILKPGGTFVTSTACIGDTMKFFKIIVPVGRFFRLIPLVKVFTTEELVGSLTGAGFTIDHQWSPGKGNAVFIVAKK